MFKLLNCKLFMKLNIQQIFNHVNNILTLNTQKYTSFLLGLNGVHVGGNVSYFMLFKEPHVQRYFKNGH